MYNNHMYSEVAPTFFWSGVFSQWHKAWMTIDGQVFNCCEQYMMWCKAVVFGDNETAAKILQTNNPREQKQLGRSVKGFNADIWNLVSRDFVFRANMAKFSQNRDLRNTLIGTAGTLLIEASHLDKIWGIGYDEENAVQVNRDFWGSNWLGLVLTEVRDIMIGCVV